jgi:hypothetical protein
VSIDRIEATRCISTHHDHAATGASFLIYTSALAGAMWIVVAAVALASSGQLSRRSLKRRMA